MVHLYRPSSRSFRPIRFAVAVAALVPFLVASIRGATLVVDARGGGDYVTVQAEIDAAGAGDEVLVRCGTYVETLAMKDGVRLRGESPLCTIIDGDFDGDVIRLPAVTQPTSVESLTIRHGDERPGESGAGVSIVSGSPVITGNIIEDNGLIDSGHGIRISGLAGDAPTITRNVIRGNSTGLRGGGVLVEGADDARIVSNLILDNSASYGGGIYAALGTRIVNNTIAGNHAVIGGGVASFYPDVVLANNAIVANIATYYGGGVALYGGVTILANDAFGNQPDDWSAPGGDPTGTNGNLSVDPRFVDTAERSLLGFEPRSTSPLLDAGAPAWGPDLDLRGISHRLDGDGDLAGEPDIGARENEGVSDLRFTSTNTLAWDSLGGEFRAYRGDLDTLRSTGVYHQDPATVPAAHAFCTVSSELQDVDEPSPGDAFFYLVGRRGPDVETTLGFDSAGNMRPGTLACE